MSADSSSASEASPVQDDVAELAISYVYANLYLSDCASSLHVSALKKERITCIICLGEKNKSDAILAAYAKAGITHHFYTPTDNSSIAAIFEETHSIISAHLKPSDPGGLLVQCLDGATFSPAVAANYLLRLGDAQCGGSSLVKVLAFINAKRPHKVDKGFSETLLAVAQVLFH